MKRFFVILAAVVALVSCTKDNLTPEVPTPTLVQTGAPAISIATYRFSYNWHDDYSIFYDYRPWYIVSWDNYFEFAIVTTDGHPNPNTVIFQCTWEDDACISHRDGFQVTDATVIVAGNRLFGIEEYGGCTIDYLNTENGISMMIDGGDWNVQAHPRVDSQIIID